MPFALFRCLPLFLAILFLCCAAAGPALADKGALVISSEPGGAKIFIDGQRKGTTPMQSGQNLMLKIEEGEYQIRAEFAGTPAREAKDTVFVGAGALQPVHLVPGPLMRRVSAGCFQMGSPASEPERSDSEGPQHKVCLPAFELGQYEVTFAEWDACVAAGGCGGYRPEDSGWGRGDRPVINVSWDDIQGYLQWLNAKTGQQYRLPSEAEWEYAARAGTTTPFSTGRCISTSQANYDGKNADYNNCGAKTGVYLQKTQPVGRYPANPWGFHDLHGNVWEWVDDCWNDRYAGAPSDGSAWRRGDCSQRVLRGGSWNDYPWYLRAAYRYRLPSGYRLRVIGFRLARTLTP